MAEATEKKTGKKKPAGGYVPQDAGIAGQRRQIAVYVFEEEANAFELKIATAMHDKQKVLRRLVAGYVSGAIDMASLPVRD